MYKCKIDVNAEEYADEGDKVTLRALAFDNYAPHVPLYVYNLLPEVTSIQDRIAAGVLCLESLKQMLLSYNSIYRGAGTLLINLLRQNSSRDSYTDLWQAQYGDGAGNKIFTSPLHDMFIGKKFSQVSGFIYHEFQIILFAIVTKVHGSKYLLINPGHKILKKGDECLFIAHDLADVLDILKLHPDKFSKYYSDSSFMNVTHVDIHLESVPRITQSMDTLNESHEFRIGKPECESRNYRHLPLCNSF